MTNSSLHQADEQPSTELDETIWFTNEEGRRIRCIMINGIPWFVAMEICKMLGNAHTGAALRKIPAKHLREYRLPTSNGRRRRVILINEAGLYKLILRSDKKEAEPFIDWVTERVLPQIRATGYYARPGVLPSGVDPQVLALISQLVQGQTQGQTAIAAHLSELVTIEREKLEAERARARLARFPSVSEIPRESVRQKLHEVIDTVAMARGCCTGPVWRELYLELRRADVIDLYAKKNALRKRHGRWFSLIEIVERAGLLDIVYTTARELFTVDIAAKPKETRLERILMREEPPTKKELLEAQEDLITEQVMAFAMGADDLKTLN